MVIIIAMLIMITIWLPRVCTKVPDNHHCHNYDDDIINDWCWWQDCDCDKQVVNKSCPTQFIKLLMWRFFMALPSMHWNLSCLRMPHRFWLEVHHTYSILWYILSHISVITMITMIIIMMPMIILTGWQIIILTEWRGLSREQISYQEGLLACCHRGTWAKHLSK